MLIDCEAHNHLVIEFILLHQPVCMGSIYRRFKCPGEDYTMIMLRLCYLKIEGLLDADGQGAISMWSVTTKGIAELKKGASK